MIYESPRMPAWGAQGGTMEYGSFQAEEFGDLQRLVDGLFYDRHAIDRLDLIVLPPGYYDRQSLCDQLNSALAAHGWGAVYGTVE